ncbi:helix-turn-helix domain-containing protein [Paraburkholderia hospita]|uniref:helix-turn-helix domain-containing protein n=1 Tax=Paraburkholderia hospita TaxID=169430 RepID=UPI00191C09CD|nr:XRE family transcriptional regulator [Paraburkholderia hospita]
MVIRLKLLRKQLGLSLQELADRSGLTKSYVSKVERGISTPSIAAAMKLADALKIDVNQLFFVGGGEEAIVIVRAADRVVVGEDSDPSQPKYQVISPSGGPRSLVPFMITPAKDFATTDFKEHEGEEFLFVHRGKIEIDFADHKVTLSVGDAVHFNARIPHRIRSVGTQKAEVLLVVGGDRTIVSST